jgi:hypothetical protein
MTHENSKTHLRVKFGEREGVVGKECTKCRKWKSLDDFSKQTMGLGGVKPNCKRCEKIYREQNKEKRSAQNKEWMQINKEKRSKQTKEYRQRNREKLLIQHREWREKNKDKCVQQRRKWYLANQENMFLRKQRRAARKNVLRDDLTAEQLRATYEYFNGGCALTGRADDTQMDHTIPLSIGHGGTFFGNVYPLNGTLNLSKFNNNIFEWFEANRQRFELSQERFERLISWLAELNDLSVEDYRDYVYWCHENPHCLEDLRNNDEGEAI